MLAKIYQPAKTAMQSGAAKTDGWVLEFTPVQGQQTDALMGWTGAGSTQNQVRLQFPTREAALTYAERHGIAFQKAEPQKRRHIIRPGGYGDNFANGRRVPWSH